uniref:Uncharacterized protein n=1 Tax=Tetraselmis sp. GSL018 TaxID=582737 RepID=A0A061RNY0_9CHLO|eukprot:CAMPEP_0177578134 /NCGR_PEP_ID=MMETSP0419_2-20121207/172_1 /TAXON_ID=582737 /ORGANISM="Tetraselmis sp., Strain GSL018" /LENGTH=191 /DNA_ID=CAMNT_0019066529 /DNA_START=318 /DNA_END=893 /DNA_ORIENTATION=+
MSFLSSRRNFHVDACSVPSATANAVLEGCDELDSGGSLPDIGDYFEYDLRRKVEYFPGTDCPVDGWFQPCVSCSAMTAHVILSPDNTEKSVCRKCVVKGNWVNDKTLVGREDCTDLTTSSPSTPPMEREPMIFGSLRELSIEQQSQQVTLPGSATFEFGNCRHQLHFGNSLFGAISMCFSPKLFMKPVACR